MDEDDLKEARDYALEEGGGSGAIIRSGYTALKWGDQGARYDVKSTTKSIGVTALGLALKDELVDLNDKAQEYLSEVGIPPDSNEDTGWLDDLTILHLTTHTAGFEKPGSFGELLFEPGAEWSYSDGGTNWLADLLTVTYEEDLESVMFQRVFEPLGIDSSDLSWRKNQYRPETIEGIERREFGAGIKANMNALSRIGYLYLREGDWEGEQIIDSSFVEMVRQSQSEVEDLPVHSGNSAFPNAPEHHGLLWWNNADGELSEVPEDAYWSWGLGESFILVVPSVDIVAVRAGGAWRTRSSQDPYEVLQPFLRHIAASVQ
jgi:CubicO group peptidase (beta-lactamase class C family)